MMMKPTSLASIAVIDRRYETDFSYPTIMSPGPARLLPADPHETAESQDDPS
jgi:hypothetical protein